METTIVLPYPAAVLSPNARVHWAVKARAIKASRQSAWWAAKYSKLKLTETGDIHLYITFRPPDNRVRDEDNMLGSLKSSLDGIADGFGVNDSRFKLHHEVGLMQELGGVVIRIVAE